MARHRQTDAAVRGRIYVSSRTSPPKNGVLATEEGSIYGRSGLLCTVHSRRRGPNCKSQPYLRRIQVMKSTVFELYSINGHARALASRTRLRQGWFYGRSIGMYSNRLDGRWRDYGRGSTSSVQASIRFGLQFPQQSCIFITVFSSLLIRGAR